MSINTVSKMLIAFSVVMILMAMNIDTTVSTGYGRVNNLGLLNDKSNMLMLGGIGFIAGIILFATAKVKQTPEDELAEKLKSEERMQSVMQGVEQKFEKVSQVADSVPDKFFNFIEAWVDKVDNIRGRFAVLAFIALGIVIMPISSMFLILVAIYALSPFPTLTVMTHLLITNFVIYLVLGLLFIFTVTPDWGPLYIMRVAYLSLVIIGTIPAIRFIKRNETGKLQNIND